jgi:hypothetical protein
MPDAVAAAIDKKGRLNVGQRDARYLPAASAVLDVLQACSGSAGDAAKRLGITTSNLSSFITDDDGVLVEANRIRAVFGLRPLRRD